MWVFRSFLVWAYAFGTILSCTMSRDKTSTFSLLVLFLLHIGLLHRLTSRYSSRPAALSVLRRRMIICAIFGPVLKNLAVTFSASAVASVLIPIFLMRIAIANGQPESFFDFVQEPINATDDGREDGQPSTLFDYSSVATISFGTAVGRTIIAWVLTRGHLNMLISERDYQLVVESAQVYDVTAFSLVGALGLSIGSIGIFDSYAYVSSWFLMRLLDVAAMLAGQLLVGAAVAEQRVLLRPVKMGRVLCYVWVVHFVLMFLSMSTMFKVRAVSDGMSWIYHLIGVLAKTVVVFAFGKMCLYRYRVVVGLEASRVKAQQNDLILSSRV